MPKNLNLSKMHVANVLFSRWRDIRGIGSGKKLFVKPTGITWEELRKECKLTSAADDENTIADLKELAKENLVECRFDIRNRLKRIIIPFAAEQLWCQNFSWTPPPHIPNAKKFFSHPWHPALAFCKNNPPPISFADALAIDNFLKKNDAENRPVVPIKERSLEIFGDEKRLDKLAKKNETGTSAPAATEIPALFSGRLSLAALRCRIVPEPLAWLRGACPEGAILVVENAATFDTFRRWDKAHPTFSAIIYGGGDRFTTGVLNLPEIFAELAGERPVFYFGDLDPDGLRIPYTAAAHARANNLPAVRPLLWAYETLFQTASSSVLAVHDETGASGTGAAAPTAFLAWLEAPALITRAQALFTANLRIPQEALGWEQLRFFSKNAC